MHSTLYRKLTSVSLCLFCAITVSSCGFLNVIQRNFGDYHAPRFADLNRYRPEHPENSTIKIVSYNIKFSKKIDAAIKLLSNSPELAGADIICLQEMSRDAVQKIAHTLNYNYVYYPAVLHPITNDTFGNAVLSRWPITDDRKIILPSQRKKKLERIAVGANIRIGKKDIMVYSVHFDIFITPFNRRSNINRIVLSTPPKIHHTITAGDFNTFSSMSKNAIVDQMSKSGFNFVTKEIGWTHRHWLLLWKKNSVDHIFTKGFETLEAGKINNRGPSDHMPVWAVLKIK